MSIYFDLYVRIVDFPEMPESSSSSLFKALDLLTLLTAHPEGCRLKEICIHSGLPRPTVIRTLQGLAAYGLLEKCDAGYRLTREFYEWSSRDRHGLLRKRYRPVLESVARATGELVLLGLQEGNAIVHIDFIESDQAVRVAPAPMTRHELATSALGKLALSRTPRLRNAISDGSLQAELAEIDGGGPGWNREESNAGVIAVADWGLSKSPAEPMIAVAWPVGRFTAAKGQAAIQAIREGVSLLK